MSRPSPALLLPLLVVLPGSGVSAQQPRPSALREMAHCRTLPDVGERARCFDAAWDAFEAARAGKRVIVMEEEDVQRTRRGLFGFGGLRLPFLNGEEDAPTKLEGKVVSAGEIANGRYQFRLEDGAVWQTTEAPRGGYVPQPGSKVVINRGAIGNYFVRFGKSSAVVRAKRVQ